MTANVPIVSRAGLPSSRGQHRSLATSTRSTLPANKPGRPRERPHFTTQPNRHIKSTLDPSKIHRDPKSQVGSHVVSEKYLYRLEAVLQSAIYGGVFQAAEMDFAGQKKRSVAIKIMLKALERKQKGQLQEDIHAELKYYEDMKGHPNVLVLSDSWADNDCIFIVMPFAEYQDLFEVLKKRPVPFSEREARWLFEQILSGAYFLHMRRLAFRDHSMENVLMFKNPSTGVVYPMITDPGQAVRIQFDNEANRVTGLYADKLFGKSFRAPEVYRKQQYNPVKVDTFCLGWMLFYVLTKHQPFDRAVDNDPHWPLVRDGRINDLVKLKHGRELSPEATRLLGLMLHPDMNTRFTLHQAIRHEWFRGSQTQLTEQSLYAVHLARPKPREKRHEPKDLPPKTAYASFAANVSGLTRPEGGQYVTGSTARFGEKRAVMSTPLYASPQFPGQPLPSQHVHLQPKPTGLASRASGQATITSLAPRQQQRSLATSVASTLMPSMSREAPPARPANAQRNTLGTHHSPTKTTNAMHPRKPAAPERHTFKRGGVPSVTQGLGGAAHVKF